MNRSELIDQVAERTDTSKETIDRVLTGLDGALLDAARRGDRVTWSGLMTVDVTERPARTGRNPQDGSTITIPAARVPRIRAGARLKKAANRDS
jgi:DNA-binding protein HU-beta